MKRCTWTCQATENRSTSSSAGVGYWGFPILLHNWQHESTAGIHNVVLLFNLLQAMYTELHATEMLSGLPLLTRDEHALQGHLNETVRAGNYCYLFQRKLTWKVKSSSIFWAECSAGNEIHLDEVPSETVASWLFNCKAEFGTEERKKVKSIVYNSDRLLKRRRESETPPRNCQIWTSKEVCCYFHVKSSGEVSESDLLGPQQP